MPQLPKFHDALASPVPSFHTAFTRDGAIDEGGIRSQVDRCITNGAKALMLTFGDSLYSLLTDEEVALVTRIVIEQTRRRAVVIAADRVWWTGKTVEFARHCRELGADLLMVLPPDWAQSGTPDTLVAHYAAVAREIPVMVVTNYMIPRGSGPSLGLLKRLKEEVPGIVALKDDFCGDFARQMCTQVCDRWTVVSGGLKANHLEAWPYGCQGYLTTLLLFRPEITRRYWAAIEANDAPAAGRIIQQYETPFFNYISGLPGGFNAGIQGMLELYGIAGRWRRSPYHSLTDGQLEELGGVLRGLKLL